MTTVTIGGGSTKVTIGSGSAKRITLDRRTVAEINTHRPRIMALDGSTPVSVTSAPTTVRTGGGMGVQGLR